VNLPNGMVASDKIMAGNEKEVMAAYVTL